MLTVRATHTCPLYIYTVLNKLNRKNENKYKKNEMNVTNLVYERVKMSNNFPVFQL